MIKSPKSLIFLFAFMAVASALIIPVEFSVLESSKTQKVVIFHDPSKAESVNKLEVMQKIDTAGTYESEYEYIVCDVTLPQNVNEVQQAGFKEFPQNFTQTTEGGIEPYGGDFSVESFAQFHKFRMVDLTDNKVQRVKDTDGVGDVEGVNGLLALSADRPVFVKMYEVTNTHFCNPSSNPNPSMA